VLVDGIDLGNRVGVSRKIGFVPEVPNLFDFFSVEYNLKLFARLFQIPFLRIEEILEFSRGPHTDHAIARES
jgi:ABC-type multidrug transport system ATPase subunit